jgi:hypothetical protein
MIQGMVIKKVVELIARQFKLDKILSYVEDDNELDHKVNGIEKRLDLLEKMAHPKRDFVTCNNCKCKVEECGEESVE